MAPNRNLSRSERFLRIFTDIRAGEGPTALLLFANIFLILCAYYLIKPLREAWISVSPIEGFSKLELKAYSPLFQVAVLLPVTLLYGRLAERWHRRDLITWATVGVCLMQIVFWVLDPGKFFDPIPGTAIAFYVWVGLFGVFVVAQAWAFAADVYQDERGRRMIPFVAIGATAGAAAGSYLVKPLVEISDLGTGTLLLMVNVPLVVSIGITRWIDRRGPLGTGLDEGDGEDPELLTETRSSEGKSAFRMILTSPYLLPVAITTLLLNWVNTNGENLLFKVISEFVMEDAAGRGITGDALMDFKKDQIALFYGNFFMWVNVIALFLQTVVVSRLLKYGGVALVLLALPSIALMSYSTMALVPILFVVKWMKVAENSTDYSVNNTARHVLWLPLSSEETLKGKTAIDSVFVRVGDLLAALTIFLTARVWLVPNEALFALNVGLVLVWIYFTLQIIREHRKLTDEDGSGTKKA